MSGDGASALLAVFGLIAAGMANAADRPRAALILGAIFCAPALVRLFVAAVAG